MGLCSPSANREDQQLSSAAPSDALRIVSLVPSWTASLWDLGLGPCLVGRTRFCTYPPALAAEGVGIVGGTKDVRIDRVLKLSPDLVITNDEENTAEVLAQLTDALGSSRVLRTFPRTPDQARAEFAALARRAGAEEERLQEQLGLMDMAHRELLDYRSQSGASRSDEHSYVYLIWMDPWMAAGNQSYISALLAEGGFANLITTGQELAKRYPIVDPNASVLGRGSDRAPLLFLSSEPFPFKDKHISRAAEDWRLPQERCLLVDGRALSWYGSLMTEGYREVLRLRKHCDELSEAFPATTARQPAGST